MKILTELCQNLRNWFDRGRKKWYGQITISNGEISIVPKFISDPFVLQEGQYFRIMGSVFNDGVHKYHDVEDVLTDEEEFFGAVWSMAIPPAVLELAEDIEAWQNKYGGVDSEAMSPFQSESFGGYSYSKGSGGGSGSANSGGAGTWQGVFANRLNPWRKI